MKKKTNSGLSRTLDYVGAGLAGRKLRKGDDEATRQRAAFHLQERLGRMRGLPQKVGQILSMADSDTGQALTGLQNGGPALPLDDLLEPLSQAWGRPVQEVCASIEPEGLAASLGQVHRATLHDGREVAIKVRFPGIHAAIETDLRALGWLSIPLGGMKGGFDLAGYREVLQEGLAEELDYRTEARNQEDLARAASGLKLVVPEVIPELSSEGVLTTTWEAGETLDQAREWTESARGELGASLVQAFLELTFDHGLVHADPHPGNYAFRRTPGGTRVVLYDYGCVQRLTPTERMAILRLIRGAVQRDTTDDPFALLVELGFDADLLRPLRGKLAALCTILFEPFASRGTFDLSTWNRAERVAGVLGEDRLNFRAAGSPRLVFFLRAFEGLCFYLRQLGQPVRWSRTLAELFDRHAQGMAELELTEPSDPSVTYGCLATSLEIHVTEDGRSKARLTLPAGAVERLEHFIDEDLEEKIQAHGIVVEELVESVRANSYAPQDIFNLQDGTRHVAVRLT